MQGFKVVTAPAAEPVTAAQCKSQLHISGSASDDWLTTFAIPAARQHTELFLQRALISRQIDVFYSRFGILQLPHPPLIAVDSVQYLDGDDVEQTLHASVYDVDPVSEPACIYLAYGQTWPTLSYKPNPVTVRITTGYGTATDIPPDIIVALMMLVGHLNENREMTSPAEIRTVPNGYESLLWPYRIQRF